MLLDEHVKFTGLRTDSGEMINNPAEAAVESNSAAASAATASNFNHKMTCVVPHLEISASFQTEEGSRTFFLYRQLKAS